MPTTKTQIQRELDRLGVSDAYGEDGGLHVVRVRGSLVTLSDGVACASGHGPEVLRRLRAVTPFATGSCHCGALEAGEACQDECPGETESAERRTAELVWRSLDGLTASVP